MIFLNLSKMIFQRLELSTHEFLHPRKVSIYCYCINKWDTGELARFKSSLEMDDYTIDILQQIRETEEWTKDDNYCERKPGSNQRPN